MLVLTQNKVHLINLLDETMPGIGNVMSLKTRDPDNGLIYVSHEGTITYTGMHLVELAKKMIPSNYLVTVKN